MEYKLSYNNAVHPGERMFTWNEYAKRVFAVYGTYTEKEIKKISALIADNQWDKLSGDSLKVIAVENYIKKNINYRKELDGNDVTNIEIILKTRVADRHRTHAFIPRPFYNSLMFPFNLYSRRP